jgi:hypothetical protein
VDLLEFPFVVAFTVAAVEVERGSLEMDATGGRHGNAEALRGLARDAHEQLGEAALEEPVQNPSEPVVVQVLGLNPGADQVLGGLAGEEFLEEVTRSREEPQPVEDHGLHRLAATEALLRMDAEPSVDLFDHSGIIDDARNDAEVVDVLHFYLWSLPRFVHDSTK